MKNIFKNLHRLFTQLFFDPLMMLANWRALPYFIVNLIKYSKSNKLGRFKFELNKVYFTTSDRFLNSGSMNHHYFHQDLWAASKIFKSGVKHHIDVGSRIDGFIGHILSFCKVTYIDIRPLDSKVENLSFLKGSITDLPFESESIDSLSCLHVIEHIGLGRYGDDIDPEGHIKAAHELSRVLKKDGLLYFGTPIGKEGLYFDAHRVFDPQTILDLFNKLKLIEYKMIGDQAFCVESDDGFLKSRSCKYGCGLFVFTKQ